MAAITRRFRKNAMLYQLNYDRRRHYPRGRVRWMRQLVRLWLAYGINYSKVPRVVYSGADRPAFRSSLWGL